MNLDDLQKQWAVYDRKLDTALKLNQRAVREAAFAKARQSLVWHKVFIVVEILAGLWFAGMLGSFTFHHWGEWRFAIPSILLHAWILASIIFVSYEFAMLSRLDYGEPLLVIQKKLEARRVARIHFAQWALGSGMVLWVLWVVVGLKGIWGIDVYMGGGGLFIASNLAFSTVLVVGVIVASRIYGKRLGRSPFARKIVDSLAGESLPAAMAHLDELARYENDTLGPGSEKTMPPSPAPAGAPQPQKQAIGFARVLKRIAIAVLVIAAFILILGMALTHSAEPTFAKQLPAIAQPVVRPDGGRCMENGAVRCLAMRDGLKLGATRLAGTNDTTIVLTHGLLVDGRALEPTARMLGEATGAEVWTLDLRGHGRSAGRPGDVDYTGQYEEDLADAIRQIRKTRPEGRIVLAGHSMGGGLVVRYAELTDAPAVDAYLLFAPHLGHSSPTNRAAGSKTPTTRGDAAKPAAEPFFKVHDQRLIGLMLLNGLGIKAFNDLPTLYFNMPQGYWIDRYSFRALLNIGPEDYRTALARDGKPMLVLVGSADKVFAPEAFPAVIALHRNGRTEIVEGANHETILTNPAAISSVKSWLAGLAAPPPSSKPPPKS